MTDHTSPPSEGNTPEEGLTIWLTSHGDVTGTARAGLVRNADGSTSVAIDTRAGMDRYSADDFADLVKSLGSVAALGHSLEVPSDSPIKSTESARTQVVYDLTALRHMVLQTISPSLVQTRHAGKKLTRAERRERDLRRTIAREVGTVFDIDQVQVRVQRAATAAGNAYVKHAAAQQQEGAESANPITHDDVRGIVSEELGQAGDLFRQSLVDRLRTDLGSQIRDVNLEPSDRENEIADNLAEPGRLTSARGEVFQTRQEPFGDRQVPTLGKDVSDCLESLGVAHNSSPSVDGGSNPTVGDGQVAGVEKAAPATDATKITVTPEVIEAVAEHLFDTGVETPMINNLRSIAACLRNDLDDPVEVAASVDPTSRSHALFSQLADAIEEENERKRVFHSAQRTQVVAAKRFEDASSAVQEIELQIRKLATGEQA